MPAAGATADSASFHEQTVTVTRGDTVSIGVSHSAAANLTIGSEGSGFEVVVPLGGSGSDTITLNTYETGGGSGAGAFISGSSATQTTRPLDDAIESGVYEMRVTIDGTTQAVGQLHVEPRRNTVGDVGIAPGDVDAGEAGAGDVLDRLTARDTVAKGDYAVFSVNESGLASAFDPEQLDGSSSADGIDASIVELDPPPNEHAEPDESEAVSVVTHGDDGGDVHVFSQVEDADRFYVVWDTSDVPTHPASNQTYEFRLSLTSANHLVEDRERLVTQRVQVVEPSVELETDSDLELLPWDGTSLRVNGTTNLAPTTEVDVRARQGRPNPYLWKDVRSVSANGTFTATLDFAAAERPTSFPLWVLGHRDDTERTVDLPRAVGSLEFDDQRVETGAVTVQNVTLSEGGFVDVRAGNESVGTSSYLEPGDAGNVSVVLDTPVAEPRNMTATAFADADGDRELNETDVAYEASGSVVADNATVRPSLDSSPNGTQSTSPPETTPGTPTATATTTVDIQDEPVLTPVAQNQLGDGSSGGVAPLSPLTAIVAFVAAVLLARRQ